MSDSKKSLEEQAKGYDEKIKKAREDGKQEQVLELEKERDSNSQLVKELNDALEDNKTLTIQTSLTKSLADYETIDDDTVSFKIKSELEIVDNEVKFKNGSSLKDGIASFFENKPNLLKAKGNSGSGSENQNQGRDKLTDTEKAFLSKLNKLKG